MLSTISFFVSQRKYKRKESSFGFEVRVSPDSWPFLWCPNSTLCARCWLFFTRQKVIGKPGFFACLTATCAHLTSVVIKYNEVIGLSHFPHLINQNSTLDLHLSCFVSVVRGGGINRLEKGYRGLPPLFLLFPGKGSASYRGQDRGSKKWISSSAGRASDSGLLDWWGGGVAAAAPCVYGRKASKEGNGVKHVTYCHYDRKYTIHWINYKGYLLAPSRYDGKN